jgi:CubicO group peptidase (beta-lactamase class C family)
VGPGQFGWSGAFGTDWVSDSAEDLVAIMMIQRYTMGPVGIHEDFRISAYQCIDD